MLEQTAALTRKEETVRMIGGAIAKRLVNPSRPHSYLVRDLRLREVWKSTQKDENESDDFADEDSDWDEDSKLNSGIADV
jgi:hypothetical protein